MPGYVVHEADIEPVVEAGDTVEVRTTIDRASGAEQLIQRVMRFKKGRSLPRKAIERDEVAYVAAGRGTLLLEGEEYPLESETAVYIRPGETYEVENPRDEELLLISVTAPEPADGDAPAERRVTVRLADQEVIPAGKDREFRFGINPAAGCREVTQFVGMIPPGRAPTHYHLYDEVIYVLDGEGVLHLDGFPDTPITKGTCIHLPPPVQHCLENTGDRPLHVLGVFHPAGSAAEAYEDVD